MRTSQGLLAYLAAFAFVLILPLLSLATIATYQFAAAERARLEASADNANQDIVILIEHEIATRVALLRALSTAPTLRSGDLERFEVQVRDLARLEHLQFIMIDPSGQQVFNTIVEPGEPLPRTPDLELYHETFLKKDVHVSNLFFGSVTGALLVQVAIPIRKEGRFLGTLSATLSPDRVVQLLREGLPPGPFYATVLDREGVIVARSAEPKTYIGKALPALAEACRGAKSSVTMVNPQNVSIFGYCRRPNLSGWVIAAVIERDALTAPLINSLSLLALIGAALLLLATASACWIGRRLTRAHGALVLAAQAIGEGRQIPAFVTPLKEANLVGAALADASRSIMIQATELQRTNQALEGRVLARTEELQTKTTILETTIDTMTQGLIVIDLEGRIPICSTQARKLLDLPDALMDARPSYAALMAFQGSRDEYVGLPADARACVLPRAGDDPSAFEYRRPSGMVLQVHTVPVPRGGGFVRTITDVTERARHEHELEQAKETAERASRAKGDFLATISHEMRTPLNAMIGYSDLLCREATASDSVRRYAGRISGAGAALLSLIDDILDLGRIEAGVIDIRAEPFVLRTCLDAVVSIVKPQAQAKALRLDLDVDAEPDARFLGDQDRLRQVLVNLLSNAIKFTHAGSVTLRVRQRSGSDGQQSLHLAVSDTGIGIAAGDEGSLFQRFHQLDPSLNRRFEGAGLGLAISKQLVEHLGGRIGLTSCLGAGSTFWFELPVVPTSLPTPCDATGIVQAAKDKRVLVVEDVTLNQDLARELLEIAGYAVDIVGNGAEAVAAAKRRSYSLILMDLSMPEMDGLTATRLIREAGIDASQTPIIACTANVLPAHERAFHAAGVDAYLRKPMRQNELYATIARVLGTHAREEAVSEPVTVADAPQGPSLVSLLGAHRAVAALDTLAGELNALTDADPRGADAQARVARLAHAMISTACMLDMNDLAQGCRTLETACLRRTGIARALAALRPLITQAVTQGEDMKRLIGRQAA